MDFQVEGAVEVVVVGREAPLDLAASAALAVLATVAVLVVVAGLLTTGGFGFCVCVCACAIPGAIARIATASHKRANFPIARQDFIAAP